MFEHFKSLIDLTKTCWISFLPSWLDILLVMMESFIQVLYVPDQKAEKNHGTLSILHMHTQTHAQTHTNHKWLTIFLAVLKFRTARLPECWLAAAKPGSHALICLPAL